ncbi:MAG TPA: hypothetical protein VKW09_15235 [bacterium]|nr:hypothetical protein [bacterium]
MSRSRFLWFAPLLALAFGILAGVAGPKPGGPSGPPLKHSEARDAGETFCPAKTLVYGAIVIPNGRCYLIAVLRDRRGTFLAFAPEDTHIPPGQRVRLDTPAGPKLKGRLFLVPLETDVALVPVNNLTLVPARIDDSGIRLTIVVLGTQAPNPPAVIIDERER